MRSPGGVVFGGPVNLRSLSRLPSDQVTIICIYGGVLTRLPAVAKRGKLFILLIEIYIYIYIYIYIIIVSCRKITLAKVKEGTLSHTHIYTLAHKILFCTVQMRSRDLKLL